MVRRTHGPLIHQRHLDKVLSYFKIARDDGAQIRVGGARAEGLGSGYYVQPTLFTHAKSTMRIVGGAQKLFVTYEVCNPLLFGSICEEPSVRVASAPVVGTAIGAVSTVTSSVAGDNYFPTIASEKGTTGTRILLAYYTNRFDPFHHRQDIELVALNPATSAVLSRQRATSLSSEPDADPLLGGTFIGDYIEVTGRNGVAFTHYNANRTLMKLLGLGALVPQQDSYLNRSTP